MSSNSGGVGDDFLEFNVLRLVEEANEPDPDETKKKEQHHRGGNASSSAPKDPWDKFNAPDPASQGGGKSSAKGLNTSAATFIPSGAFETTDLPEDFSSVSVSAPGGVSSSIGFSSGRLGSGTAGMEALLSEATSGPPSSSVSGRLKPTATPFVPGGGGGPAATGISPVNQSVAPFHPATAGGGASSSFGGGPTQQPYPVAGAHQTQHTMFYPPPPPPSGMTPYVGNPTPSHHHYNPGAGAAGGGQHHHPQPPRLGIHIPMPQQNQHHSSSSGGGSRHSSSSIGHGSSGTNTNSSSNSTAAGNNSSSSGENKTTATSMGPPGYSLPARYYPNNPSKSSEGTPITSGPADATKPAQEASMFTGVFDQDKRLNYVPYPEIIKMSYYEKKCHTAGPPPESMKPYWGIFLGQVPNHLPPAFISWALDLLAGKTSLIYYAQAKKSGFAKAWFGNEQSYQTIVKRSRCLTFDLNGIWLVSPPKRRGRNLGQKFFESRFSYRINPSIYVSEEAREERVKELAEDYYVISSPVKFPDEKIQPLKKSASKSAEEVLKSAPLPASYDPHNPGAEKSWKEMTDEELAAEAKAVDRSKEKKKYTAPALDQFGSDDLYVNLPTDEDRFEYYEQKGKWERKYVVIGGEEPSTRSTTNTTTTTSSPAAPSPSSSSNFIEYHEEPCWEMDTVMIVAWRKMYHTIQDHYQRATGMRVHPDDPHHDHKTCPDTRLPYGPMVIEVLVDKNKD